MKQHEILYFGGGTQSVAVLCAVAEGLITPKPELAIIADTGYENPKVWEYYDEHVIALAARAGVDLLRVGRWETTLKKHDMEGLISPSTGLPNPPMYTVTNGKQHGILKNGPTRGCTAKWKSDVVTNALSLRLGRYHIRRQWVCFSYDEARRAQKPSYAGTDTRKFRFPLLEMRWSREKSIKFVEDCGYPTPPRSACFFCPFHNDEEWNKIKDEQPLVFRRAVDIERELNEKCEGVLKADALTFHRSGLPLDEVEFRDTKAPKLFCDHGNCFT